jgi:hypothetical protein
MPPQPRRATKYQAFSAAWLSLILFPAMSAATSGRMLPLAPAFFGAL